MGVRSWVALCAVPGCRRGGALAFVRALRPTEVPGGAFEHGWGRSLMDRDTIACAKLVERGDADRFAAAMAAPVSARGVLFPLYAFNLEVARAPWVTQETMIAEMRLQWWRDALDEIAAGGIVRRHEVVTPLAHVLDAHGAQLLDRLVAARRWDIYRDPFEDAEHFDRYLTETSGHLMVACARSLGARDDGLFLDLGWAAGLANFLRAIPDLERQGKQPLVDARADALATLAHRGLDKLTRAKTLPSSARPAILAAWQAGPILRQAVADPQRITSGRLGLSEFSRRARLSWVALTGRL